MSASTHMPADGEPLAGGDLLGDAGEQLGLALLDPLVLLRLRGSRSGSRGRRPSAAPPTRTCARTCACVSRIGHSHAVSMWAWPVATTRCVPAPAGRASSLARRRRTSAGCAPGGDGVEGTTRARAGCAPGAGRAPGGCRISLVEHGEVVEQRLGGEVDEHHVGAGEDVLRIVAGGGERPERRRLELWERRVGRRLDVDRERPGDRFHGHGLAARVQAVHGRGRRRRGPGPPSRTQAPDDPSRGRASPRCGAAPGSRRAPSPRAPSPRSGTTSCPRACPTVDRRRTAPARRAPARPRRGASGGRR